MRTRSDIEPAPASRSYTALRHEGAPPWKAQRLLGLQPTLAAQCERLFQARRGGVGDAMKPRFARHAQHVAAVMAQGGFPALQERRR